MQPSNSIMNYKSNEISTKQELINSYENKEFDSPFRSTIPLIELFFENKETLKKIFNYDESYNAVFEDETKPYETSSHPSCTDLRLYNKTYNYCIEAKQTESKYGSVAKELKANPEKQKTIKGFLNIINNRCNTKIEINDVLDITYQIFASACKVSDRTEMLYFCFNITPEKENYYKTELKKINKLTNSTIPIKIVLMDAIPSNTFKKIQDKWTINKERHLSEEIKSAMTNKIIDINLKEIIEIK